MRNFAGVQPVAEGFDGGCFAASSRRKGSGVSAANLGPWCFGEWVSVLGQAASAVTIENSTRPAIERLAPRGREPDAANLPPRCIPLPPKNLLLRCRNPRPPDKTRRIPKPLDHDRGQVLGLVRHTGARAHCIAILMANMWRRFTLLQRA